MKSRDSKHGDKDDVTVEISPNEAYADVSSTTTTSNDCTTHLNQAYEVVEGQLHTMELHTNHTYEVVKGRPNFKELRTNEAYGVVKGQSDTMELYTHQ